MGHTTSGRTQGRTGSRAMALASLWLLCAVPVAQARRTGGGLSPADNAASALGHYSSGVAGQPSWQVVQTDNFRVLHLRGRLAQRLAEVAERERTVLWQVWTGVERPPAWTSRCVVYLYPSYREMIVMTGGQPKGGSAVVKPSRLYRGRILSRRVNLTADDTRLLGSTVPHEISHLVFGDIFGGKIPLWVNEGAATMAESDAKQRYYARILARFMAQRQIYQTRVLVGLERYPDFPYQSLFYAQASSLVAFFISLADGPTLVRFIKLARKHGYDYALQRVYRLKSLERAHRLWLEFVRTP